MKKIFPLGILVLILSLTVVFSGCKTNSQPLSVNQELTNQPPVVEEETPTETTVDTVKGLFANKYDRSLNEVTIVINKETEGYARGLVQMVKRDELPGTGGEFLAAKADGQWKIVFEGIGAIPCADLVGYDFPQDMI